MLARILAAVAILMAPAAFAQTPPAPPTVGRAAASDVAGAVASASQASAQAAQALTTASQAVPGSLLEAPGGVPRYQPGTTKLGLSQLPAGSPNGLITSDANNFVPLANESPVVTVPPAAAANGPAMFADFAARTYASAINGRLYTQPMESVIWGAGASAGGYYVDPASRGHAAVPGAPRFSFDPARKKHMGVYVEGGAVNLIPDPQNFITDFSSGADGQGSTQTDIPPLFDGFKNLILLRDVTANAASPFFTVTLP
ncbi:MAG TPA: hypothetical protein VGC31_11035, partial [Paenirhodobacter sp.]